MALPKYAMGQASFPEMYERELVGPLFRPFAEALLDAVSLARGDRVIDVACGTGIVARVAKERLGEGARVVGVDVSAPMLETARRVAPDVEWREGDAAKLPVASGEIFDVACCHQGLQFFADPVAAVKEMKRVLAPGGRVAVATWRGVEEIPMFLDLERVAVRHLGEIADARYSLGDAAALERILESAGLRDVRMERVSRRLRFAEAEPFIRMNAMALVGMSRASQTMSDEERASAVERIAGESLEAVGPFRDGAGLAYELATNAAIARA